MVGDLFVGYSWPGCGFIVSPPPSDSIVAACLLEQKNNSGILALLFVELVVQEKTWSNLGRIECLDYCRMRLMLQAIRVVTKQNAHDIRWM